MCNDYPVVPVTTPGQTRFGEHLRRLRLEAGLSQRALAMKLAESTPWTEEWWDEVDRLNRSIRRWEKDTIPRGMMVIKLAQALGRLPAELDTEE